tara:strand:+ start:197 stop:724 length:528 start_codon:yes stop_codon:yes gene_type:complete
MGYAGGNNNEIAQGPDLKNVDPNDENKKPSLGTSYIKSFRNSRDPVLDVRGSDFSIFGAGGYEIKPDTTGTSNGASGGTGLSEITIIHNYLPYKLSSTTDLGITVGCSGSEYPGWSGGATGATYNEITYAHPDWSSTIISGSTFGAISFGDFFVLTGTSENDSRQCCYSCPATGY